MCMLCPAGPTIRTLPVWSRLFAALRASTTIVTVTAVVWPGARVTEFADRARLIEESSGEPEIEYTAVAGVTFVILKSATAGVIADFGLSFLNPKLKLAGEKVAGTDAARSRSTRPAPAASASAVSVFFAVAKTGSAELIKADFTWSGVQVGWSCFTSAAAP